MAGNLVSVFVDISVHFTWMLGCITSLDLCLALFSAVFCIIASFTLNQFFCFCIADAVPIQNIARTDTDDS